jgi:predicted N-formylglutamate amidohydrolase
MAETPTADGEAPPFHTLEGSADTKVLIICDHASRTIGSEYDSLGLREPALSQHIAWDIGSAAVGRKLAALLAAPAVFCGTSRLVIDCNRLLDDPSSVPPASDGIPVPGNQNLGSEQRAERQRRHFWPYHGEIVRRIGEMTARGAPPLLVSVHSFTPSMNGAERPWHVGLLWDHYESLSKRVIAALRRDPALVVGENEPYTGWEPRGYALYTYGEGMGLPMCVFEIRQDLIATDDGAVAWAQRLAAALPG